MQTIVSYANNSYSILSDVDVSLSCFSDQITSKTGVSQESQRLIINGRQLTSELEFAELVDVDQTNFVQLQLRLLGGKGGFGALLRTSKGTKKTTNFGACRDLNGRRLKDIQLEQKLQEMEAKREEDESEKNQNKVKDLDPTPKVDSKKEVLDKEIRDQRNEILQNVTSAMDQGFAVAKEKKKASKEKKRKRDEVKLPDDLWDNFGLVPSEDEDEESNGKKKQKKLDEKEDNSSDKK
jgi:hypothetical protein